MDQAVDDAQQQAAFALFVDASSRGAVVIVVTCVLGARVSTSLAAFLLAITVTAEIAQLAGVFDVAAGHRHGPPHPTVGATSVAPDPRTSPSSPARTARPPSTTT